MRRFALAWLAIGLGTSAVAEPEAPSPEGLGAAAQGAPVRRRGPRSRREGVSAVAAAAEQRLRSGMPLLAATAARECLDRDPDDLGCVDVLGRSLALIGRCDRALAHLARVRAEGTWTPKAAVAEGVCQVRTEDFPAAVAAFDEAARLDPHDPGPWLQRGLVHARLGLLDELEHDLARLREMDDGGHAAEILETWHAYVTDDPGLDGRLERFARHDAVFAEPALVQHVFLVDCLRWLDLGDPLAAGEAALRGIAASRNHTRLQACRGEALRRAGDAGLAERFVHRPYQEGFDAPLLDAIRVRALVDLGRTDDAAAVLATLVREDDPEVIASTWYLARARGDGAEQRRLEAAYAAVRPTGPDLRRLIPATEAP